MRGYLDRGCVQSDLLATHRWKEGALTELLLEIDSSIHALSSWHQGAQTNSPWNVDFQNQFPRNPSLWSVHGIPSFLCGRNQSPEELLPANCAVIDSKICLSVSPTQKIPHPKSWGNPLKKGPKRADGPIIGPHSLRH
jgi:hypothetical protein